MPLAPEVQKCPLTIDHVLKIFWVVVAHVDDASTGLFKGTQPTTTSTFKELGLGADNGLVELVSFHPTRDGQVRVCASLKEPSNN